jgi:hypothetical protein
LPSFLLLELESVRHKWKGDGSSHGWLLLRVDASTPRPRGHTSI